MTETDKPPDGSNESLAAATTSFTHQTIQELIDVRRQLLFLEERELKLLGILEAVRPIHVMFGITEFDQTYDALAEMASPRPRNKGHQTRKKYASRKRAEKPSREELEGPKEADLLVRGEGEA